MKRIVLFLFLLITNAYAQTNVRGWYADGQVWIVWETAPPHPETYAIYASDSLFTAVEQATLIGRLFEGEWTARALQEQTRDSTQTYRVPDGDGGVYRLVQNEGLFVETVHETGAKYYAVVQWGESVVTAGVNLTSALVNFRFDANEPVQCHLQGQTILQSGHKSAFYYMWADGRDDH